jgi:two-component system NarL family sensor kinase
MQTLSPQSLLVLFLLINLLIIILVFFITVIIYRNKQKQKNYFASIKEIKLNHENDILKTQLEIQEQTFQNISREIHDNIGQKLTLAKLQLNTTGLSDNVHVSDSVKIIGDAIRDLSDISRSMSSEFIQNNGFIKAIEFEMNQLSKTRLYSFKLVVTGETVFMEAKREVILFRIVQEAISNIIKHAEASEVLVDIHFKDDCLLVKIKDNGKGFDLQKINNPNGLFNMEKRALMLKGSCGIQSDLGKGTIVNIQIPLYES